MLIRIVYLVVRRILGLAVLALRADIAKDAELLVLRHENAVLRRHADRVRYEPADRVWLAALARRLIPRNRWTEVFPVTPGTLLACRKQVRHEQPAQTRPAAEVPGLARLGVRLAKENRCGDTAGSTAK